MVDLGLEPVNLVRVLGPFLLLPETSSLGSAAQHLASVGRGSIMDVLPQGRDRFKLILCPYRGCIVHKEQCLNVPKGNKDRAARLSSLTELCR